MSTNEITDRCADSISHAVSCQQSGYLLIWKSRCKKPPRFICLCTAKKRIALSTIWLWNAEINYISLYSGRKETCHGTDSTEMRQMQNWAMWGVKIHKIFRRTSRIWTLLLLRERAQIWAVFQPSVKTSVRNELVLSGYRWQATKQHPTQASLKPSVQLRSSPPTLHSSPTTQRSSLTTLRMSAVYIY